MPGGNHCDSEDPKEIDTACGGSDRAGVYALTTAPALRDCLCISETLHPLRAPKREVLPSTADLRKVSKGRVTVRLWAVWPTSKDFKDV